jgi:hypothetical protein
MARKKPAARKKTSRKNSQAKKSTKKKATAKKSVAKKGKARRPMANLVASKKRRAKARKRELIDTGTDKRYVRRDEQGQFQDVVDVSRSLSMDIQRQAETVAPAGHGDRGD